MASIISRLNKQEQDKLLADLNYLNLAELKRYCKAHSIPYSIYVETKSGPKKTAEHDRKGVIIKRVTHFLTTGEVSPPTLFRARVVADGPGPSNPKPTDKLCYGHYQRDNLALFRVLETVTKGEFRDGAIARMLARDFWSKGVAPTLREFATAWTKANKNHDRPNPEWAFLSDRSEHNVTVDWKSMRNKKAKRVLRLLKELS